MFGERKIKLGEKLGTGAEKTVYTDPDNEKLAKAVFHKEARETTSDGTEQTPEYIKARFYLTKILHLLYPKNIPDMHMSASEPNMIVVDRAEHDKVVSTQREIDKLVGEGPDMPILDDSQEEVLDKLRIKFNTEWDKRDAVRERDISNKITALGVSIDGNPLNFSFDKEGNAKYLDSFKPWYGNRSREAGFKRRELLSEIKKLGSESDKKRALNYLNRLQDLFEGKSR